MTATPVDIEFVSEYLMDKLGKKLIESDNCDNYSEDVKCCPRRRSHKIIGRDSKPKQRYKCKDCKEHFPKQPVLYFSAVISPIKAGPSS